MSKGTKQIRFGRIIKLIEELRKEKEFYGEVIRHASPEVHFRYRGKLEQIDSIINKLEELGR